MTSFTHTFDALTSSGTTATAGVTLPYDVSLIDVFVPETAAFGGGSLSGQGSAVSGLWTTSLEGGAWTSGGGQLTSGGSKLHFGRNLRFQLNSATSPSITVTIIARPVTDYQLFQGRFTADGETGILVPRRSFSRFDLQTLGGFGSGTLTAKYSIDDASSWLDLFASAQTVNGVSSVTSANAPIIKLELTGSTSPAFDWWLFAS